MREAVAMMDRAGQEPDAYIEADLDFHLALAGRHAVEFASFAIDQAIDI